MNSTNHGWMLPPGLERANLVRGLRAALALSVPLIAGQLMHRTELSLWGGLAGLFLILSDGGGPYRRRARKLLVGAMLMVVALFIGAVCGGSVPLAVAALALGAFAAGLGPAFGRSGAALGRLAATSMVVSLAHPAGLPGALERAAQGGIGAAWALLLALILWPFRPHQALFDLGLRRHAGADPGPGGRDRARRRVGHALLAAHRASVGAQPSPAAVHVPLRDPAPQ